MKQYFILGCFVGILILSACDFDNQRSRNKNPGTSPARVQTISVPPILKNSTDKAFTLHQDTLFYDSIKYSGLVYSLYNVNDTMQIASYLNGLEEGIQKKWYANQQVASMRNYHAGKKIDKHIGYWENGQPKFEFYFKDGEHHGVAKEWYQNGQYYRIFHYQNGYEQGSQKMWWENGIIRANYVVKNGRRYGLVGLKLCMNQNDTILKK
jgi:antitoxin component YwqK of YwqJK toxin-antitoxin module